MQEWYLMNNRTKPNMLGGYENQSFNDFKNDAFQEVLDTSIASDVLIYNFDLSEFRSAKIVVQGGIADTMLVSMERTVLAPIGTLKSGEYVFFENTYWIIDGRPGNNTIYEKATMKLCHYKLRWQKDDGTIIERWANITSASKYDVGETGTKVAKTTSDNFSIIIPNDLDSYTVDGKRVFIDLHPTNPTRVFKITRLDDVLYDYKTQGGVISLIADKTELNLDVDKPELKLCDYIKTTDDKNEEIKPTIINSKKLYGCIKCRGQQELIVGSSAKTFSFEPVDKDGNKIENSFYSWDWEYDSTFSDYIKIEITKEMKCKIKVLYHKLIVGQTVKLSVLDDEGYVSSSIILEIGGGI